MNSLSLLQSSPLYELVLHLLIAKIIDLSRPQSGSTPMVRMQLTYASPSKIPLINYILNYGSAPPREPK
jgi:hypothetical protein